MQWDERGEDVVNIVLAGTEVFRRRCRPREGVVARERRGGRFFRVEGRDMCTRYIVLCWRGSSGGLLLFRSGMVLG